MFQDSIPLQRHCLLDSANMAEIRDQVSHHLWSHQMRVPQGNPLQSRLCGVYFGSAAVRPALLAPRSKSTPAISPAITWCAPRWQRHGRAGSPQRRHPRRQPDRLLASERSLIRVGGDCRSLILRVERPALERRLQQAGRPLRTPLVFDVDVAEGSSGMAAVRQTLDYLCRLHQDPDIDRLAPALAAGFPDYLMSLLLMQLPQLQRRALPTAGNRCRCTSGARATTSKAIWTKPSPWRSWPRSPASTRTLQNGFARFLGQSPIDYILRRGGGTRRWNRPGDNVTDILLRHGVTSFGHFASHYRKRYGCRPSDTRAAASAGTAAARAWAQPPAPRWRYSPARPAPPGTCGPRPNRHAWRVWSA